MSNPSRTITIMLDLADERQAEGFDAIPHLGPQAERWGYKVRAVWHGRPLAIDVGGDDGPNVVDNGIGRLLLERLLGGQR